MNFPKKPRCVWALDMGDRSTRCHVQSGHGGRHIGFLANRYETVKWYAGDGREFQAKRKNLLEWKNRKEKKDA